MKTILLLAGVLALTACGDEKEKERQKLAEYVASTKATCEHAKGNVAMVAGMQSTMNRKVETDGLSSFQKVVCDEAKKAAADLESFDRNNSAEQ